MQFFKLSPFVLATTLMLISIPGFPGNSAGGGGFVKENSDLILRLAANGLADLIKKSSPEIYANLPPGSQEFLANVIQNVHYQPEKERFRHGNSLMFDYGTGKKGPYIIALKPFFLAYSSFPYRYSNLDTQGHILKDVRRRLLHEVAHLYDVKLGATQDEDQDKDRAADLFAQMTLDALETDTILCGGTGAEIFSTRSDFPTESKKISFFVFNRSSGLGVRNDYLDHSGNETVSSLLNSTEFLPLRILLENGSLISNNRANLYNSAEAMFQTGDRDNGSVVSIMNPLVHNYHWEMFPGIDGNTHFTPHHGENIAEHLILLAGGKRGELHYQKDAGGSETVNLECQTHYTKLVLPTNEENRNYYLYWRPIANSDNRTDSSWRAITMRGMIPQELSLEWNQVDQAVSNEISKVLGNRIEKMLPLEYRSHGASTCAKMLWIAKLFRLRDGRTCSIGLEAEYEIQNGQTKVYVIRLSQESVSKVDHFTIPVACFQGSKEVPANDLAQLLPADRKTLSTPTPGGCP